MFVMVLNMPLSYLHMGQSIQEWTKRNLWNTAKADHITSKFFKGCIPQNVFDPFLNTLPHTNFWVAL